MKNHGHRSIGFGVAILATAVTCAIRLLLWPVLGDAVPHMAFFPAVMIAAYYGGIWPGLLATLLCASAANIVFTEPHYTLAIKSTNAAFALPLFVPVGAIISGLSEMLHRSRRRIAASERRLAVTLASIGDAVIASDTHGGVTFMNLAAETLTGWRPMRDASDRPLSEVFRIINEHTRQTVEDPVARCSLGKAPFVGLANHTGVLLARDGREISIDDSAAPIIDDRGGYRGGGHLVFRDTTQRRCAEEAEALRAAYARQELAVRWLEPGPLGSRYAGRPHRKGPGNPDQRLGIDRLRPRRSASRLCRRLCSHGAFRRSGPGWSRNSGVPGGRNLGFRCRVSSRAQGWLGTLASHTRHGVARPDGKTHSI